MPTQYARYKLSHAPLFWLAVIATGHLLRPDGAERATCRVARVPGVRGFNIHRPDGTPARAQGTRLYDRPSAKSIGISMRNALTYGFPAGTPSDPRFKDPGGVPERNRTWEANESRMVQRKNSEPFRQLRARERSYYFFLGSIFTVEFGS